MFSETQNPALSEYIADFIHKAKNPQSDLKQIDIPSSLENYVNELGVKFKSSFGIGARNRTPWLACLDKEQGASKEGVYPVLLFHTQTNQLYVTYGVSATAFPKTGRWPTKWPANTTENLPKFPHEKYETSSVVKQFDCSTSIDLQGITNEFLKIVNLFLEMLSQVAPSIEKLKTAKMDELAQQLKDSTQEAGLVFSTTQLKRLLAALAFPQTCRHFSQRSLTLPLELIGAELIEMLVASNTIVETLDVIEDV